MVQVPYLRPSPSSSLSSTRDDKSHRSQDSLLLITGCYCVTRQAPSFRRTELHSCAPEEVSEKSSAVLKSRRGRPPKEKPTPKPAKRRQRRKRRRVVTMDSDDDDEEGDSSDPDFML
ncbi:Hypp6975 [Branchiostoma lanceolatum]|uniref:Hypp6975 protein n=1 Tax=Branchiostoma lanceolatum TaxID=7740 RepID=A0A8J9YVY8_BRALA|nr:Hypp6975 [Branchiostoma lanceolatum]